MITDDITFSRPLPTTKAFEGARENEGEEWNTRKRDRRGHDSLVVRLGLLSLQRVRGRRCQEIPLFTPGGFGGMVQCDCSNRGQILLIIQCAY
jgi:hypothetical protein